LPPTFRGLHQQDGAGRSLWFELPDGEFFDANFSHGLKYVILTAIASAIPAVLSAEITHFCKSRGMVVCFFRSVADSCFSYRPPLTILFSNPSLIGPMMAPHHNKAATRQDLPQSTVIPLST
jgi:hypothetical protein